MRRISSTPLIAAAAAGLSAWISIGSMAVASADTTSRFGLLPPLWLLPILMIGFALTARLTRLSVPTSLPLFFSLVLVFPWLPWPIPVVFLVWTGRVVVAVWLTVAVCMLLARGFGPKREAGLFSDPHRAPRIAATTAFICYVLAGWALAGILPGGDEPHYLVISQSLIRDGDIQIENNHSRGDYWEYFAGELRPDFLRRGTNGQIYSVHAPGLSAIVAPAYALFGYPGVVGFLSMVAAVGGALLWRAAFSLTGQASAAWFAWAAAALTVPFFFEAFTIYPDGLGATLVLYAAMPLVEGNGGSTRRWVAVGVALSLLPWLHTRLAILSAVLGLVLLLRLIETREGRSRIVPFLFGPAAAAAAWLIFFWVIYGTFNPAAPYGGYTQSSPRNMLNGLPALMFDQQFGILPNAPVYGFCLAGLVALARSHVRLAFELSAVAMAYLLATSAFHMWWGGSSPPARFAAAVLPLLALPGAWLWKSTPHSSTRAVGLAALLVSLAITGTLVSADGGRLAYNVRDGYARAAEWLSPIVDLSRGLPSFFRQTSGGAVTRACIWIAALLVSVGVLRIFERRRVTRSMLALATPTCLAASTMLALTAVWKQDGVAAAMPEMSQLNILQDYDVRVRPHGIAFRPFTVESAENVLSKISIATPTRRGTPPGGTLLLVPGIVAGGRYELRLADSGPAFGTASLVIGRLARPIKSWDLSTDFRDGSVELELPVNVESLVISGDGEGSRRAISLHSSRIWERSARLTRAFAHRAERYGPGLVFFFDEGAFAEVPGFWVRGGAGTQIAAASAEGGSDLQLLVRNAPVANRVEIEVDGQNQVLDLQPREERILPVQIAGDRPAALIQIRSRDGFRPSLAEPGSTDTRFLGVWIEFRP